MANKAKNRLAGIAACLLLAAAWLASGNWRTEAPAPPAARVAETARKTPATSGLRQTGPATLSGVVIRDIHTGAVLPIQSVDLGPALARIAAGEKDPHRNDGAVFHNRSGSLPRKPRGYYREYVVRTPGLSGPGPQRLVLGKEGEVYYSPDHYDTFLRIEPWRSG